MRVLCVKGEIEISMKESKYDVGHIIYVLVIAISGTGLGYLLFLYVYIKFFWVPNFNFLIPPLSQTVEWMTNHIR